MKFLKQRMNLIKVQYLLSKPSSVSYDPSFCIWLKRKTTFLSFYCCLLGYSEVKWYRNSLHACQCWLYSNSSEEPFRLILFCSLSRISQSCRYCRDISSAERYNLSYFLPYREGIFVICLKDCLSFAREVCHLPERLCVICYGYGDNVDHLQKSLSVVYYRGCQSLQEIVFHFLERLTFIC